MLSSAQIQYTTNGTARSGSGLLKPDCLLPQWSVIHVRVRTKKDNISGNNECFYRISAYRSGDRISGSLHKFNTSKTSALHPVPPTPSEGAQTQPSMRAPMLSSASTETATDLAPVKSASTPPTAPPEAADFTQVSTASTPSVVDSHTSM